MSLEGKNLPLLHGDKILLYVFLRNRHTVISLPWFAASWHFPNRSGGGNGRQELSMDPVRTVQQHPEAGSY